MTKHTNRSRYRCVFQILRLTDALVLKVPAEIQFLSCKLLEDIDALLKRGTILGVKVLFCSYNNRIHDVGLSVNPDRQTAS